MQRIRWDEPKPYFVS